MKKVRPADQGAPKHFFTPFRVSCSLGAVALITGTGFGLSYLLRGYAPLKYLSGRQLLYGRITAGVVATVSGVSACAVKVMGSRSNAAQVSDDPSNSPSHSEQATGSTTTSDSVSNGISESSATAESKREYPWEGNYRWKAHEPNLPQKEPKLPPLPKREELARTANAYAKLYFSLKNQPELLRAFQGGNLATSGPKLLEKACEEGDAPAVAILVSAGVEATAEQVNFSGKGYTPLIYAVTHMSEDMHAVEALVCAGADPNRQFMVEPGGKTNCFVYEGDTALLKAVGKSDAVLECLLKAGADPNIANAEGYVPMCLAVTCCSRRQLVPQLLLLLDYGADPRPKKGEINKPFLLSWLDQSSELKEKVTSLGWVAVRD